MTKEVLKYLQAGAIVPVDMETTLLLVNALKEALADQEFILHDEENEGGWSDWICPKPDSYLMKCCDCGLVHEMQTRVANYESRPSEDFVVSSDPDLQAQFRVRRHEVLEATPPAAQPVQEPVAWGVFEGNLHDMFFTQEEAQEMAALKGTHAEVRPLYTAPPAAQRPWLGLTKEDMPAGENPMFDHEYFIKGMVFAANILKEKNNG